VVKQESDFLLESHKVPSANETLALSAMVQDSLTRNFPPIGKNGYAESASVMIILIDTGIVEASNFVVA
jgi:hypothetical protein